MNIFFINWKMPPNIYVLSSQKEVSKYKRKDYEEI